MRDFRKYMHVERLGREEVGEAEITPLLTYRIKVFSLKRLNGRMCLKV